MTKKNIMKACKFIKSFFSVVKYLQRPFGTYRSSLFIFFSTVNKLGYGNKKAAIP